MTSRYKIIRTSTIPNTLYSFCRGWLKKNSAKYETVVISSPGELLERLEEQGQVRSISVPMERHISPWKDLVSLVRMVRAFHRERPDMVHSITPKAGLISMMAAWMTRVPVRVHTFTGLVFPTSTGLKRQLLMWTDRITCACATHIIPEGEGVKHDLQTHHITRKPLRVLGYGNLRGIDLDYYNRTPEVMKEAGEIRRVLGIGEADFVFIFIGRLVGDKGINELVTAFKELAESEKKNVHLILVGREETALDPLKEETREIMKKHPCIHCVGEQKDVRPWYAMADALVFPSYREGMPNVVIEAGAMGLPAIVTDINGSREIIRHEENGIIVPPREKGALLEAMKTFVSSPIWVKEMSGRARQMIASRYEQSFVWQCLNDFYAEVLPLSKES